MADDKTRAKLFSWRQGVIMTISATTGIGLSGYMIYRKQGGFDAIWFAATGFTVAITGAIFFFIARYARKSERED